MVLSGLAHRFAADRLFENLDLTVRTGENVALVGPSGCGKTTLLRIAGGLLSPAEGRVSVNTKRRAIVFQEPRLLPWKSVADNVTLGLKAQGMDGASRLDCARQLLARLDLSAEILDRYPHELSGGMAQRIALGRALAIEPDLLLLDEPLSAVDIGVRRHLQGLLVNAHCERPRTMLLVTHDLREALTLCDRIVVLGGQPARIVHQFRVEHDRPGRDGMVVERNLEALLGQPAVAQAFAPVSAP